MGNYKDISGRNIKPGDIVSILSSINLFKKLAYNMSSLVIGEIVETGDLTCNVKIGNEVQAYKINEISKIDLSDNIDDVIIHIAHDIETLQLKKESEIIDNMLNPLED